jgi:ATP-dependent Lhr-like helicase
MLKTEEYPPWSGGGGKYAIQAVLEEVRSHRTTLIFHNTRAQAEIFFHHLWFANEDNCPSASITARWPANSASAWNRR